MIVKVLEGDWIEMLATLPAESVDCVVTSPPYWGLRSYLPDDHEDKHRELGSEPTLAEHLQNLVAGFRDVRRVMKPSGTLWLNYGDCYATSANGRSAAETKAAGKDDRTFRDKPFDTTKGSGLPAKNLCLIPERLVIALQNDGWFVRAKNVWGKPNGMPDSSGRYRPGSSHEMVWMLTKNAKHFYDHEAVKMPPVSDQPYKMPDNWDTGPGAHGSFHRQGREKGERRDKQRGHSRRHQGFNERWDKMSREEQQANGRLLRSYETAEALQSITETWGVLHIATSPFREAHFATFPPALAEVCIKAGCSEKGCCPDCGAPWVREVETSYVNPGNRQTNGPRSIENRKQTPGYAQRLERTSETKGWKPSCTCELKKPVPAVVLDPFGGAGTTGLVANRLKRDAILIELNPDYAEMARRRIKGDCPLFSDLAAAE